MGFSEPTGDQSIEFRRKVFRLVFHLAGLFTRDMFTGSRNAFLGIALPRIRNEFLLMFDDICDSSLKTFWNMRQMICLPNN
ncbi:hypothetical protein TNIN_156911 [Trichonephila inaurata madagascariensis]|uniref:Uncharacterized protein n=1 Tax=Trichonephila inaurata madagascariensis TaxID=2747483 RepID=A0A8X6IIL4_9ARAC|nr:hypothetical protein TNIN_156911 [Trichonephila inaurata madagascariensis]